MPTRFLDRYINHNSHIHRLDPRVKVVATTLFILSNVLLPDGTWPAFLLAWASVLGVSQLSKLGLGFALKRSFIVLPFVLVAITVPFTMPGEPVFSFSLGPWQLQAGDVGLLRFLSIVVRGWLSVQMAILLTATTQFPDLMHALHHLRLPRLLVAVISFMYRYLFLLVEEAERLLQARQARSAQLEPGHPSGGSIPWRAKVAGHMVGQLFLRSYERSDRVYNAMLARGFGSQFLTLNPHVMRSQDWLALGLTGAALLLIQIVGQLA